MTGWLTTLPCTRAEADAAAAADDPFAGHDATTTLVATEDGDGWALHLYTMARPDARLLAMLVALAPSTGAVPKVDPLPEEDWVALSQAGLEPVDAGRFHVHTGDHAGKHRPGQWPIRIDAGLAFGTGQHATTRGCLIALQRVARRTRPSAMLDVGTGTGVLALSGRRLFPGTRLVAADIDRRAIAVARANARRNRVPPGGIRFVTAFGIAHPAIAAGAPYDLVVANILAGPLAAMASGLARMLARDGNLLLAGLLAPQRQRLVAIYRAHGLQLVSAGHGAEWPVLWLRQRTSPASRAALRRARRGTAAEARRADSV